MSKNTYTYERIDKDNSVILHVDFQVGLCQLVKNHGTEEYRHGIMAHAKLGEVFKLPTVVTTNAEDGEKTSSLTFSVYSLTFSFAFC